MKSKNKVLVLSGEDSGDQLAIDLINTMQEHNPNYSFSGMGGDRLQEAGVELLVHNRELSIIGFWEVFTNFHKIKRAWKCLKRYLIDESPALVILIDYPGFNLRFAKLAKKHNCRVLYYVGPQLWAWKSGRIKQIQQRVDHMALLFSFEKDIYDRAQIANTVVGHPLSAKIPPRTLPLDCQFEQLGLSPGKPVIALCPGSRCGELKRIWPLLRDSAKILRKHRPELQFVVPLAPARQREDLHGCPEWIHTVDNGKLYSALQVADAAIVASGTITLQTALHEVPLIITYKLNKINYWIAKKLIKSPFIGLCNIVAGQKIAEEVVQEQATATELAQKTLDLLIEQNNQHSRKRLQMVRKSLPIPNNHALLPVIEQLIAPNNLKNYNSLRS